MRMHPRLFLIPLLAAGLSACDDHALVDLALASDPVAAQQAVATRADPDAALAQKVERALGIETGSLPYGIEVTAGDGHVVLWGTVDSTAARKRLEITAAGVVGVRGVENHLQVDPGA